MAARQTGFGLLASGSVQEAHDMALIAQTASLESRVPFVHFFDGFRTSHEVRKIELLSDETIKEMMDDEMVTQHRMRGMNPDKPVIRGTAQNPDVFFQGRETVNKYYDATPEIVTKAMKKFGELTGRHYKLFDYVGAEDAEKIIVIMGSGAETVHEVVEYLNNKGEKVGMIKVRLYRPLSPKDLVEAMPKTVKSIAVLDRTKEPGSSGEPLYIDVRNSVGEALENGEAPFTNWPKIVGGRYGLGSKDFTPNQVIAVFDNLSKDKPKNHFTVGIEDDMTNTSLELGDIVETSDPNTFSAMFYGLGSDGTVGANKDAIKIIGDKTENNAQGYFVYDSKKSGSMTISHLRFGEKPLRCPYLVSHANYVACHNYSFLEKYDMLKSLKDGGTFLLETHFSKDEIWDKLPKTTQQRIIDKKARFFIVDAINLAESIGLGNRINMIMQTCFFEISNILPREKYIQYLKDAVKKTYGKKGDEVVKMNWTAIDKALENLTEVEVPDKVTATEDLKPAMNLKNAPDFVKEVLEPILAGRGDDVTVGQMPEDGSFPTGTTQYEKRNVGIRMPIWDKETCIQCGMCSMVCPHAAIRTKIYDPKLAEKAPETFKSCKMMGKQDMAFTVQVAPEDCTGCGACVSICPAHQKDSEGKKLETKAINMKLKDEDMRQKEAENWDFFLNEIPDPDRSLINLNTIKGSQYVKPLLEFSGACAGCGETAYIKLVTQICGDRLLIANATGCSSIYGGNLPTTPYCKREDGRGPAWSNSLFEDNAEFGMGMRLASDKLMEEAVELLRKAENCECDCSCDMKDVARKILDNPQKNQDEIEQQRANVEELKDKIKDCKDDICKRLYKMAQYLVKRSVWIVGGDGWAYDIGYGGLDHVLASGKNVKVLVLDTEVYSNTGGQMSKATPLGAVAKFAAGGKPMPKKDLGLISMTYGNIYVAKISIGANPAHALKAMIEAENYDGPAIVIAYSHCIAHGIDLGTNGFQQQKNAVNSGHWPLYRFNPDLIAEGKNPLSLDSKEPSISLEDYVYGENRFRMLLKANPEASKKLIQLGQKDVKLRYNVYKQITDMKFDS
jgi:pyruvate-ferredoxin/flavodoxin oxidoreductase